MIEKGLLSLPYQGMWFDKDKSNVKKLLVIRVNKKDGNSYDSILLILDDYTGTEDSAIASFLADYIDDVANYQVVLRMYPRNGNTN